MFQSPRVIIPTTLLILFVLPILKGQTSCDNPINLIVDFPIDGNGQKQIPVDNSERSQFYIYTATKEGTLKMWSGFAYANGEPDFETDLKVYQTTCDNLIADIDSSPGLFGNCEFEVDVAIGDTYIFEWSNHNWGGEFNANYFFQEPVDATSCDDPTLLKCGTNHHDSFFKNQYFEFTASKSGILEISTCGIPSAYSVYGFDLLSECLDLLHVDYNYDCDPDEEYDWFTLSYAIAEGETITIETPSRNHDPYGFNASLIGGSCDQWLVEGSSCVDPIDLNDDFPIIGDGHKQIPVDNSGSSQFFTYTADKVGTLKMWSGFAHAPDPSFGTDLKVYQTTCDNLIADIDFSPGLLGGCEFQVDVEIGDTYIFEWSNHKWAGQFNADYYFQEPVDGIVCDNPNTLVLGSNPHNSIFKTQYFEYTASQSGVLELSTCGDVYAYGLYGFDLLIDCSEKADVDYNYDCGPYQEYDWFTQTYPISEGETITVETPSRNHAAYDFKTKFIPTGNSCDNPIEISETGIYAADNSYGDQWFAFTAPETTEIAISTGPHADGWGDVGLARDQNTRFKVFDTCDGNVIAESDDSAIAGFQSSFAELEVTAGVKYLIQWEDQFVIAPHQYQFEIFKVDDIFKHTSEINAQVVDVGVHRALLNYNDQQWFKYIFPSNGVLLAVNRSELAGRVIPSYQMFYGDNGLDLELPHEDELDIQNWSDSEPTETNFMYEGVAGEEILLRVEEVGGIHFSSVGNRDFELAFFEGADYQNLCYYEEELIEGTHEINSLDGDQKYKYTATKAGAHIFSANDNPSILISIKDACFGDALYSKYNNFYFEMEMKVGEEVYLIFSDEFGGSCDFEIRQEDPCSDVITTTAEACDAYTFDEEILTISGQYEATLTNQAGCDSLVNLSLTILEITTSETIAEACESYEWNDVSYASTGVYEVLLENAAGCDSIAILDLTILEATSSETIVEACESYEWNAVNYTSTGVYEVLLENAVGCDSTAVLDLAILEATSSETIVEACESYEWNAVNYPTTGVYEVLLENAVGCDSTAVLDLTILEATSSETIVEACESYEWNAVNYTSTGVYEVLLVNAVGCDSTTILDLTILETSSSISYIESFIPYDWNGETYYESGTYETLLINEVGCDSLAQLDIAILDKIPQTITFNAITSLVYGQGEIQLAAFSSSGLEVSYKTSNQSIVSVKGTSLRIIAAGEASITASQSGNDEYLPAEDVTTAITIGKASLTVRLDDKNKMYGAEIPTLTYSYEGFVHDEDDGDLRSIPRASTTATTTSEVGSYVITAFGGVSGNYEFVYVDGSLEIGQADQTVDFETPSNWVYGDEEFDLLAEASSGLSITFESSDKRVAVINGDKVEIVGAGASTITAIQTGNQNYNKAETTGELVVAKAPLKLIAGDQTIHFRQQVPTLIMHAEGLVNGESIDVIDELPEIWSDVHEATEVGQYDIYLNGGKDDNYELDLVNGTLTVDVALSTSTLSEEIHIYPNPPRDQLHIDLPESSMNFMAQIIIRDVMGHIYYHAFETNREIVVDMRSLPKGLLIVQIQIKDDTQTNVIFKP